MKNLHNDKWKTYTNISEKPTQYKWKAYTSTREKPTKVQLKLYVLIKLSHWTAVLHTKSVKCEDNSLADELMSQYLNKGQHLIQLQILWPYQINLDM